MGRELVWCGREGCVRMEGNRIIMVMKSFSSPVERRRRDRINELIKMLAQIVPGCQKKDATTGNIVGVRASYSIVY